MADEQPVTIPSAVAPATGRFHHHTAIDQQPDGFETTALVCAGCSAPVEAVRSVARRQARRIIKTPAYFQLADPAQHPHDPGCYYDWHAETDRVAAHSLGLLVRHSNTLTLTLPTEPHPTQTTTPAAGAGEDITRRVVAATAAKIDEILRRFEQPGMQDLVRVTYRRKRMAWSDFYYDLSVDDPRETLTRLHHNLQPRATHPMVVAGKVHRVGQTSTGKHFIDLHLDRSIRNDTKSAWLHARIMSATLDFADYHPGDLLLAYGTWDTYLAPGADNEWITLWTTDPNAVTGLLHALDRPSDDPTPLPTRAPHPTPKAGGKGSDTVAVTAAPRSAPSWRHRSATDAEIAQALNLLHVPHEVQEQLWAASAAQHIPAGQLIAKVLNTYLPGLISHD